VTPDRARGGVPATALLLLGLFAADLRGLVDLTAVVGQGAAAVATVALEGGDVLASMMPAAPAKPRRRHRRPRATITKRPPAAAAPSRTARAGIPQTYLRLYREAGAGEVWGGYPAWAVLAGIGQIESGHGQSSAPGVRSGVNAFGCCAGPMQFNLRNGPPSTWDTYGRGSPYDPANAIPAAGRLLRANGARRDLDRALYSYNHSSAYVAGVKAQARRYQQGA